ncbi:hypothetical protein HZU73_10041 [Apis mellifera caucasica]|uniref:Uncharacterized protein LOC726276 n=1 Tax=Apis mellifera TaxID=7460 RepID=A0A7M7G297_APIME|nr:uncharacterized protein LOC726276 [Apis mellifera]KAG6794476.1 hypothetical protein HZU73_10041 [Apis mellifera caucasica]KAG9429336.1 hypothetical protein HZU67_08666 [Apis mellifera carnica]|eukprot:XP_001122027.2 uncharacterized protein LOC726276 [Apis mellifera]
MAAVCVSPSSVTVGPLVVVVARSAGSALRPSNRLRLPPSLLRQNSPLTRSWTGGNSIEMIPDSESVCQTSEAAVRSTDDVYRKIKNVAEGEAASVTAWKRYQQLVAIVESRGGKFNRKSMIEAIFRGNDLVYASH